MRSVSNSVAGQESRVHLYRLLGEPQRLKLLALASVEELSVGELAELIGEPQPNVSRHITPLRQAGLLDARHQGTRVYVQLSNNVRSDPVVADALREGERLCERGGCLRRIADVIAAREHRARAYFASESGDEPELQPVMQLPVYAKALSMVASNRGSALDAGAGDGALLDLLAPTFTSVCAVDRSAARLEVARERALRRGYENVRFLCGEVEEEATANAIRPGVDVVFASRVLHHASSPRVTLLALSRLLLAGGTLCIIDYCAHDDELLHEQRGDVWMGFAEDQLATLMAEVGFAKFEYQPVPPGYIHSGFDAHIPWFIATARWACDELAK